MKTEQEIDNVCDVCGEATKPKFEESAILYRSYSTPVHHWDKGEIYVDEDEQSRLQTCESCELARHAAPKLLKTSKRLLAYLDDHSREASAGELALRHLLHVTIAEAES